MNEKYIRHMTLGNGTEYWYDANGNKCQTKFSDGSELWYDSNGKLIHVKFCDGSEKWYDANGKLLHAKMLTDQKLGLIPMGMRFLWKMHQ